MATIVDGESARHLSNSDLLREIAARASVLVKKEVELATTEIRADLKTALGTAKTLAIAGVAALLGLNAIVVALILGLASVIPGWAAALIVAVVLLAIAAVVGYVGWKRLVTHPLALTRKTLKEDLRWMKDHTA